MTLPRPGWRAARGHRWVAWVSARRFDFLRPDPCSLAAAHLFLPSLALPSTCPASSRLSSSPCPSPSRAPAQERDPANLLAPLRSQLCSAGVALDHALFVPPLSQYSSLRKEATTDLSWQRSLQGVWDQQQNAASSRKPPLPRVAWSSSRAAVMPNLQARRRSEAMVGEGGESGGASPRAPCARGAESSRSPAAPLRPFVSTVPLLLERSPAHLRAVCPAFLPRPDRPPPLFIPCAAAARRLRWIGAASV